MDDREQMLDQYHSDQYHIFSYKELTEDIYLKIKKLIVKYGWVPKIAASMYNVDINTLHIRMRADGIEDYRRRNWMSSVNEARVIVRTEANVYGRKK